MVKNPFPRARLHAGFVLMMVSAKGGVGKSTVTVNLAAALKARGKKVGIFDADLHGPNIPALLGIRQKRDLTRAKNPDVMFPIEARPDAMDMRPIKPYDRYGIKIMSLGLLVGDTQAITPQTATVGMIITSLMARVLWDTDVLLVDMPPGTGEPLNALLSSGMVDAALLIAVRERLAHLDNGRLVTLLNARKVPVFGVVENMTHIICPRCGELIELYPFPVSEQAAYDGAAILTSIPFHPHLIRQTRGGPPLPLSDVASPARAPLLALADAVLARIDDPIRANGSHATPTDQPPKDDCIDCP
jgi:ATP-binding protein involved in chromosome partitioning